MSIAPKLGHYLQEQQISFNIIHHEPSHSSVQSAIAAQVPLNHVAKAVILKNEFDQYLMAIIPASSRIQVKQMNHITDAHLQLVTESELGLKFNDCQKGAIPPVGSAYEMDMIWDDHLAELSDIYFEAGDHETMIHLSQEAFQNIVADSPHNQLCVRPSTRTRKDT